jgi:hypothetical protein
MSPLVFLVSKKARIGEINSLFGEITIHIGEKSPQFGEISITVTSDHVLISPHLRFFKKLAIGFAARI